MNPTQGHELSNDTSANGPNRVILKMVDKLKVGLTSTKRLFTFDLGVFGF